MADYVISVPHADGGPECTSEYHCKDLAAQPFAEWLAQFLMPCGSVSLHVGDVKRTVCDLNRHQCHDRPFRKRVRADIERGKTVVTDAHSFPASARTKFLNAQVAVLSEPGVGDEVVRALRANGWRAERLLPDYSTDDILADARAKGAKERLLIEIDEANRKGAERIARTVSQVLCGRHG